MSLSPRMPELRALEIFLATAHSPSLSAAAAELGLSQQAVSSRIAALEAQTGVPVLARTRSGSTLTPAGAALAEWADRLLAVAAEVDAGLASLRQDRHDRLRVSASLTVAEHLLPRWLVSFRLARRPSEPAAEVTLTATNSQQVLAQIRDGDSDLGFVEGPSVPRGVRSRVIGHDELVLVVRPDHPWVRRRRDVGAAELHATPLIVREAGSGTRDALDHALRSAPDVTGDPAPPVLSLSTTSAVRAAVLEGAGPAVLSALAVGDDLASGRLRRIPVAGVDLRRTLRAVWTGAAAPPAGAARDLLAHIAALR